MATDASTRQRLHSILDDMELISKELIEQLAVPKSQQKSDSMGAEELMSLLIDKDTELKELLKTAEEQEKVQKVMDELRGEVTKRDGEIRQLQRTFKEAEIIMATAVYQAKQKLASIRKAQTSKVSSEDLIKYAHRISASNSVAAPPTWGPGDPRRPYPTDLEMRHSLLSMGNAPDTASTTSTSGTGNPPLSRFYSQDGHSHHHHQQQQQSQQQHTGTPSSGQHHHHHHHQHHHLMPPAPSSSQQQQQGGIGGPLSWQTSSSQQADAGLSSSLGSLGPLGISTESRGHGNKNVDIELMSSDSSSSSSSDE